MGGKSSKGMVLGSDNKALAEAAKVAEQQEEKPAQQSQGLKQPLLEDENDQSFTVDAAGDGSEAATQKEKTAEQKVSAPKRFCQVACYFAANMITSSPVVSFASMAGVNYGAAYIPGLNNIAGPDSFLREPAMCMVSTSIGRFSQWMKDGRPAVTASSFAWGTLAQVTASALTGLMPKAVSPLEQGVGPVNDLGKAKSVRVNMARAGFEASAEAMRKGLGLFAKLRSSTPTHGSRQIQSTVSANAQDLESHVGPRGPRSRSASNS